MKQKILGLFVFFIYRLLSWTWRVTHIIPPDLKLHLINKTPFILAHWHGDELVLVQYAGFFKLSVIASLSKDGEIMSTVIKLFGGKVSRGSSSRGAVGALKGIIKLGKNGYNPSFAVDGPKGPIYKVKPGVLEVAKLLNAPIYIPAVASQNSWLFPKAWNKTYLPKPFSKIYLEWELAIANISHETIIKNSELDIVLENKLNTAKQKALKVIAQV